MLGVIYFILAIVLYFNNKYRYISVFLLIALLSANFQMATLAAMSFPGSAVSKSYDWVMLFLAVIFFLMPTIFINNKVVKLYKYVFIFLGVLIVLFVFSVFILHVEKSVAVRASRQYIFFLTILLFVPLNVEEHKKVFRLVVYATSLAAFFYCFQPFIGTDLLNNVVAPKLEIHLDETVITRYYNVPIYIIPTLILLFDKHLLNIPLRKLLITINLAALLIYQTRSLLLTLGVCLVIYYFFTHKFNLFKVLSLAIISICLFLLVDSISGERFSKGMKDLSGGKFTIDDIQYMTPQDIPQLSTSEFRFFHMAERVKYVLSDKTRAIFGVGLITEDSKLTNKLNFSVGLLGDDNLPVQVSTGDIAWSFLILNLGLLGIFAYLLLYGNLLNVFFSLRFDGIMMGAFCYIIALFITSFYSTGIILPYITGFVMLFASYAYRLKLNLEDTNKSIEKS